jgi:hypothetical protein
LHQVGFSLYDYIETHGQQNIKFGKPFVSECSSNTMGCTLLNYLCRNSTHNMALYITASYVTSVVSYYPPNILHVKGSLMRCIKILVS